jgi:hypothetical protein
VKPEFIVPEGTVKNKLKVQENGSCGKLKVLCFALRPTEIIDKK